MRFVFVMDPLSRVAHDKDTSFAFIRAAQARGHESYHCLPRDLSVEGGEAHASATPVIIGDAPPFISLDVAGGPRRLRLADVDAIFIRKDPPFDRSYLYATLLLERARRCPLIVNDPRGLRDANEKLYALNFPEWTPKTLVTADREQIHAFVRSLGGTAVIKPLDGAGGLGVLQISERDKNARAIADMMTSEGHRLAMIQEYLPAVVEGDKRVLLLDGEPLGAILRVPRDDDHRSNIHVGGRVVSTELTARERDLVRAVAPRLRADGLHFVGLDVIGERLTEVNVTSPTGIQELGRFLGSDPADKVIAWAEERARGRAARA
ncbi:glutathione synthase [Sorangium sp. So ce1099]|uniref:glutathione synthase n=1 Tax=Sorangium sp. So ce1099 TaxID=3133331 RepID=UPI003F6035E2